MAPRVPIRARTGAAGRAASCGDRPCSKRIFRSGSSTARGSIRSLETLGAERVYLLVDEVFHQHNAVLFADLDALFAARGARTMLQFGEGHEPTLDFAKQISGRLRAFAPDLILAIGGGSILDTAKVLEVFYEHPDITDQALYDRFHLPPIRRKAKLVAVPTTSGSGSEVTPFSVMYVASGNPSIPSIKRGIADYQFIPDHVILDPAFTLTMPLGVTAATGLDAFVHAMEAFVSIKPKNLFGDHFALEAMRRVNRFLPLVLKQPDNLEYRSQMQIAATMGGLALANRSSGCSHAVGKQLATLCPLAHGLSVSIMLPDVIRANAVVRASEYAEIARYLGSDATDEPTGDRRPDRDDRRPPDGSPMPTQARGSEAGQADVGGSCRPARPEFPCGRSDEGQPEGTVARRGQADVLESRLRPGSSGSAGWPGT